MIAIIYVYTYWRVLAQITLSLSIDYVILASRAWHPQEGRRTGGASYIYIYIYIYTYIYIYIYIYTHTPLSLYNICIYIYIYIYIAVAAIFALKTFILKIPGSRLRTNTYRNCS